MTALFRYSFLLIFLLFIAETLVPTRLGAQSLQPAAIRAAATTATLQPQWTSLQGHTIYQLSTAATRANPTLPMRTGVFAATNKGLYRSLDSGRTWAVIGVSNDDVYDVVVLNADASFLVLGSDKGVQYTKNSGSTWQTATYPLTVVSVRQSTSATMGTTATTGGTRANTQVLITTEQRVLPTYALQRITNGATSYLIAGTTRGIFRSTDNGATWSSSGTVSAAALSQKTVKTIVVLGSTLYAAVLGDGVYRSSDFGATWTTVDILPGSNAEKNFRVLSVYGSTLYAGSSEGNLYQSFNGTTWAKVAAAGNNGRSGIDARGVEALTQHEHLVIGAAYNGLVISFDNARSWQRLNAAVNDVVALALLGGERERITIPARTTATDKLTSEINAARDTVIQRPFRLLAASQSSNNVSAFSLNPLDPTPPSIILNHYFSFDTTGAVWTTELFNRVTTKTITLGAQPQTVWLFNSFWISYAHFRAGGNNPSLALEVMYQPTGAVTNPASGFQYYAEPISTYWLFDNYYRCKEIFSIPFSQTQVPTWYQGPGTYRIRGIMTVDRNTSSQRTLVGQDPLFLTIQPPAPTITASSSSPLVRSSTIQFITFTGTNFSAATTKLFYSLNGGARTEILPITVNSATSLTAPLPSGALAATGTLALTVENVSGAASSPLNILVHNPQPQISSFTPNSYARNSNVPLTITGTGFMPETQVRLDDSPSWFIPTYVSPTELRFGTFGQYNTGGSNAAATSFQLRVQNPVSPNGQGGGASANITVPIVNPVPNLSTINPAQIFTGQQATIALTASNLLPNTVAQFNNKNYTIAPAGFAATAIIIPAEDLTTTGSYPITLFTPAPGGGSSQQVFVSVVHPQPFVSSISPTTTNAGRDVVITITGSSFVSGAQIVMESGSFALATTFLNGTSLRATVPANRILTNGTYRFYVVNPAPNGPLGGTSGFVDMVVNTPVANLTSISPATLTAAAAASTLTLTGSLFEANAVAWISGTGITTQALTTTVQNAATATASVPTDIAGRAGTYSITLRNPNAPDSQAQTLTIQNPAASITALAPSTTDAGGAGFTLTLTGNNFVQGAEVLWNGTPYPATSVTPTSISFAVQPSMIAAAGTISVAVRNPAPRVGDSPTLTFTIQNPAPTLTSLTPQTFTVDDGAAQTITLTGTGFNATSVVLVSTGGSTTTLTPSVNSASLLTLSIPETLTREAGVLSVVVQNPPVGGQGGGTSVMRTLNVLHPAPMLTTIAPSLATVGDAASTLTLSGSNFVRASVVVVRRTGTSTEEVFTPTFANKTQVSFTLPSASLQSATTFSISVRTTSGSMTFFAPTGGNPSSGGVSLPQTFTVQNPLPTLTSLNPAQTLVRQSTTLTLTGTNFIVPDAVNNGQGSIVFVNGTPLLTTVASASSLTVSIPSALLPTVAAASAQAYMLTVRNPLVNGLGGGASSPLALAVVAPAARILALAPVPVPLSTQALTLTLTGENLVTGATVQVQNATVGAQTLTATVVSSTMLTLTLPAAYLANAGSNTLTVNNPAPSEGASNLFTFTVENPVPVATSITPTTASIQANNISFTITGSAFAPSAQVRITDPEGNMTTLPPSGQTATTLTFALPPERASTAGTYSVFVLNPPVPDANNIPQGGGTSATLTFTLTNPAPTLAAIAPTTMIAGTTATLLTLTGTHFLPAAEVLVNGTPLAVSAVTVLSRTQLQAVLPLTLVQTATTLTVRVRLAPNASGPMQGQGGGLSAAQTLTLRYADPILARVSPARTTVASSAIVTVAGSGLAAASQFRLRLGTVSTVTLNVNALTAPTFATLAIPASAIATVGTYQLTAINPAPGGGSSNGINLFVHAAAAVACEFVNVSTTAIVAGAGLPSFQIRFRDVYGNLTDTPISTVRFGEVSGVSSGTISLTRSSLGVSSATVRRFTEASVYVLWVEGITTTTGTRTFSVVSAGDSRVTISGVPPTMIAGTTLASFTLRFEDTFRNLTDNGVGRLTYAKAGTPASTATLALTRVSEGIYTAESTICTIAGNYSLGMSSVNAANTFGTKAFSVLPSEAVRASFTTATTIMTNKGSTVTLNVNYTDLYGNLSDRFTAWTFRNEEFNSSGTVTLSRTPNTSVGRFTGKFTVYAPGEYTLATENVANLPTLTVSRPWNPGDIPDIWDFECEPGPATVARYENVIASLSAGEVQPFRITFLDRNNAITANVPADMNVTFSGAAAGTVPGAVVDVDGNNNVDPTRYGRFFPSTTAIVRYNTTGNYTYDISFLAPNNTRGVRKFNVQGAQAVQAYIEFQSSTNALVAGASPRLNIRYRDMFGNLTDNDNAVLLIRNSTNNSVVVVTTQTATANTGIYTAILRTFTTAGTYTFAIQTTNATFTPPLLTGTTNMIVLPAQAARVIVSNVTTELALNQIMPPFTATYYDRFNNLTLAPIPFIAIGGSIGASFNLVTTSTLGRYLAIQPQHITFSVYGRYTISSFALPISGTTRFDVVPPTITIEPVFNPIALTAIPGGVIYSEYIIRYKGLVASNSGINSGIFEQITFSPSSTNFRVTTTRPIFVPALFFNAELNPIINIMSTSGSLVVYAHFRGTTSGTIENAVINHSLLFGMFSSTSTVAVQGITPNPPTLSLSSVNMGFLDVNTTGQTTSTLTYSNLTPSMTSIKIKLEPFFTGLQQPFRMALGANPMAFQSQELIVPVIPPNGTANILFEFQGASAAGYARSIANIEGLDGTNYTPEPIPIIARIRPNSSTCASIITANGYNQVSLSGLQKETATITQDTSSKNKTRARDSSVTIEVYILNGVEKVAGKAQSLRSGAIYETLQQFGINSNRIQSAYPNFKESDTVKTIRQSRSKSINYSNILHITIPNETLGIKILKELQKQSDVLYASLLQKTPQRAMLPNDMYIQRDLTLRSSINILQQGYHNAWHLRQTSIEQAWDIFRGDATQNLEVGVFDSGIDATHPDLANRVITGNQAYFRTEPEPCNPPQGVCQGVDFHGTASAGLIAANADNCIGIAGIDWFAKVISGNDFLFSYLTQTINDRPNMFIANYSVYDRRYKISHRSITAQAYKQNRLIVNSTGNFAPKSNDGSDYTDGPNYPGAYNHGVIAVGASSEGVREDWSEFGYHLDIIAPGSAETILSTYPAATLSLKNTIDQNYGRYGGTSAASPIVAGIANLVKGYAYKEKNIDLENDDVEKILYLSTRKAFDDTFYQWSFDLRTQSNQLNSRPYMWNNLENTYTTWNDRAGYGSVNALDALKLLQDNTILHLVSSNATTTIIDRGVKNNVTVMGTPNIADGIYSLREYEVRTEITFPAGYSDIKVWGRGAFKESWGLMPIEQIPNNVETYENIKGKYYLYGIGGCEVVPGSLRPDGCTLRTYLYERVVNGINTGTYIPTQATNVQFHYTLLGKSTTLAQQTKFSSEINTWKDKMAGTIKEGTNKNISLECRLYPNPVAEGATISYTITKQAFVSLEVYDILGRSVMAMVQKEQSPNVYHLSVSLQKLSAGTYYLSLRTTSPDGLQERTIVPLTVLR